MKTVINNKKDRLEALESHLREALGDSANKSCKLSSVKRDGTVTVRVRSLTDVSSHELIVMVEDHLRSCNVEFERTDACKLKIALPEL